MANIEATRIEFSWSEHNRAKLEVQPPLTDDEMAALSNVPVCQHWVEQVESTDERPATSVIIYEQYYTETRVQTTERVQLAALDISNVLREARGTDVTVDYGEMMSEKVAVEALVQALQGALRGNIPGTGIDIEQGVQYQLAS